MVKMIADLLEIISITCVAKIHLSCDEKEDNEDDLYKKNLPGLTGLARQDSIVSDK
jgi:hypothetical protein